MERREVAMADIDKALRARIAYDVVPDDKIQRWSTDLGYTPSHPDVEKMEHKGAADRRNALAPIYPVVMEYAKVYAEFVRKIWTEADILDQRLRDYDIEALVRSATQVLLCELVDLGIVHLPHNV